MPPPSLPPSLPPLLSFPPSLKLIRNHTWPQLVQQRTSSDSGSPLSKCQTLTKLCQRRARLSKRTLTNGEFWQEWCAIIDAENCIYAHKHTFKNPKMNHCIFSSQNESLWWAYVPAQSVFVQLWALREDSLTVFGFQLNTGHFPLHLFGHCVITSYWFLCMTSGLNL